MPVDPEYLKWLKAEWAAGRLTKPVNALAQLRANPRAFLRRYPLQNNFDCSMSGVCGAYIMNGAQGQRPGSVLRTKRMHDAETFNLQNMPGQLGEGDRFQVHGVFMGRSSDGPSWYQLDNWGPDIALTAKLTGCTFVARRSGATGQYVEVTHLQPHEESGLNLHQRMVTPGQYTYGRLRYDLDTRSINVVGIRRGGTWKVYAQKLEKNRAAIRSVHRIFPPK